MMASTVVKSITRVINELNVPLHICHSYTLRRIVIGIEVKIIICPRMTVPNWLVYSLAIEILLYISLSIYSILSLFINSYLFI